MALEYATVALQPSFFDFSPIDGPAGRVTKDSRLGKKSRDRHVIFDA
jgi:hypothetical protein